MSLPRLALLLAVVALPLYVPAYAGAQTPSQEPKCQMKVVSCNYGYLCSGQFSWTNTINGPASQFREQVTVGVKNGVAGTVQVTWNVTRP